jgi:hypothetical protein
MVCTLLTIKGQKPEVFHLFLSLYTAYVLVPTYYIVLHYRILPSTTIQQVESPNLDIYTTVYDPQSIDLANYAAAVLDDDYEIQYHMDAQWARKEPRH